MSLKEQWSSYDDKFRIEAVIHDGQWYTKDKWRKVALLKNTSQIDEWIEENKDILEISGDSYKVGYDEVLRWYKENNIPLDSVLMPKNYAPRLWNGKTEADSFIASPRTRISSIMIDTDDSKLADKIKDLLSPYGRIISQNNKYYFFGLSGKFFKHIVERALTSEELSKVYYRIRSDFHRRDILDMPYEFLEEALNFYYHFALISLKNHEKTLTIYLPDSDDRKAQIYEWVLNAIQKFDESQPVPFSGYLNKVLQVWPYDLPDNELGKPLAKFQRNRSKVETKLMAERHVTKVHLEDIQALLEEEYTKEEFYALEEQHQRWLSMKKLNDITWEENGEDKPSENVFSESDLEEQIEFSHKITKAIITAALKSEKYALGIQLIENIGINDIDLSKIGELPESFKEAILKELYV